MVSWREAPPDESIRSTGGCMEAHSETTGKDYPSWDALVQAEANGWMVIAIIKDSKQEWPWLVGPFDTKKAASNARVKHRKRFEKQMREWPENKSARFFVRPAWKDNRE